MEVAPAQPEYAIGDIVSYTDHHSRAQMGEVSWIEATWGWAGNAAPHIVYTVTHPSYQGRRMYVGEDKIRSKHPRSRP